MTDRTAWLVLHVPKCAGTTVERHLERHLGIHFWSTRRRRPGLPAELMARKWADPPLPPGAIRAVSGHWLGRSAEALFEGRPIHRSILLREPEALVLSWYNYRMMRYRAAGRATYGFGLHLASLPANPVAHFLLERWLELPWHRIAALGGREARRRLDAALGGFDIVGDISDCDRLVATLSGGLGIPAEAPAKNTGRSWQAAGGWTPLRLADLSPADRAALSRRTALDRYLWRRWACGETDAEAPATRPVLATEAGRAVAELRRSLRR